MILILKHFTKPLDCHGVETRTYLEYLESTFKLECCYVPYPPIDKIESKTEFNRTIVSLGSARLDKGIMKFPELIYKIRDSRSDFFFVIQNGPTAEIREIMFKLAEIEGVTILKEEISFAEMQQILMSAYAFLCVYDPFLFKYRGSGIAARAMYQGCMVLTDSESSIFTEASRVGLSYDLRHATIPIPGPNRELGLSLARKAHQVWEQFLFLGGN
jgi:hypothetical protein